MIVVDVALATICFLGSCHPALIGKDTPKGTFETIQRLTNDPGYGGDVLQFHEDKHQIFAIHRTWTLRPEEKREQRIKSNNPRDRVITKGCVNVDPKVYEALVACCSNTRIVIK